jgi:hypothetical protein
MKTFFGVLLGVTLGIVLGGMLLVWGLEKHHWFRPSGQGVVCGCNAGCTCGMNCKCTEEHRCSAGCTCPPKPGAKADKARVGDVPQPKPKNCGCNPGCPCTYAGQFSQCECRNSGAKPCSPGCTCAKK